MKSVRARGAALILVLWLVAALALVVTAGARAVGGHTRLTAIDLERLRAEAALDGAIALFAQHLRQAPDVGSRYRVYRLVLDAQTIDIEVTPAKGLIDANVASDEVLQALLINVGGISRGEAAALVSRIRDWIDTDDQPSGIGGAEAAQYRAAGWPSPPRNERLDDGSDLMAVMGMTPALYEKIQPFLGVLGRSRVDIGAAPPELIDALTGQPGLGQQLQALAPEQRDAALSQYTASGLFEYQPNAADNAVRVVASVAGSDGRRWHRPVWIDRNERPDTLTPWTTLVIEPTRRLVGPAKDGNP